MTPAMRAHTKQRLAERYGLDVTSAELFQLAKQIAHGRARLLSRQSKTVAMWELDCQGQTVRFVFDSQCRGLLTALPAHDSADYFATHLTVHRATTLPPHEK